MGVSMVSCWPIVVVSEFKLQPCYYFHFQNCRLEIVMRYLILINGLYISNAYSGSRTPKSSICSVSYLPSH